MNTEYWTSYQTISSKLKKRFLRKPNYHEASKAYQELTQELQRAGATASAAFCALAVARCEETLGNGYDHAKFVYVAAQLYLGAMQDDTRSAYVSFAGHITDATNTYLLAVEAYLKLKRPALASTLLLELAGALEALSLPAEAVVYYHKAAQLQQQTPMSAIPTMSRVVAAKVRLADYDGAISTLSELIDVASNSSKLLGRVYELETGRAATPSVSRMYSDAILDAETTRMLLIILLQPSPEHPNKLYEHVLGQFAGETPPLPAMSDTLFCLLQSLLHARSTNDYSSVVTLQQDLYRLLSVEQNEIVQLILESVRSGI